MRLTLELAILCAFMAVVNAVDLDAACDTNEDCDTANAECSKVWNECTKGTCACKSGYEKSGTSCLVVDNGACSANSDCKSGTCTTNKCACSSDTYNDKLEFCTALKPVGDECNDVSECYGVTGVECVGTPTKCTCKEGFILDSYKCRLPMPGESCSSDCAGALDLSSYGIVDVGLEASTCSATTCSCPETSEKISVTFGGSTLSVCQTNPSVTELGNGETCSASNACESNICATCPEGGNKCVTLLASGTDASVASGFVLTVLLIIQRMF